MKKEGGKKKRGQRGKKPWAWKLATFRDYGINEGGRSKPDQKILGEGARKKDRMQIQVGLTRSAVPYTSKIRKGREGKACAEREKAGQEQP